ncbi:MAG: LPS translocon maturation chaperone LptM [Pseudomonadota bacterium]
MSRSSIISPATLAVLAALLAGCGQKGPLYLPDESTHSGNADTNPTDPQTEE